VDPASPVVPTKLKGTYMPNLSTEKVSIQTLATAFLGLVLPVIAVLVAFSVLPWTADQVAKVNALWGVVSVAITTALGFGWVREHVTDLSRPRANGHPLVEAALTYDQVHALDANFDHPSVIAKALTTNAPAIQRGASEQWEPVMSSP
jgi:hypothetical protein